MKVTQAQFLRAKMELNSLQQQQTAIIQEANRLKRRCHDLFSSGHVWKPRKRGDFYQLTKCSMILSSGDYITSCLCRHQFIVIKKNE